MRCPIFRKQHLFIGSGVIEAGCKTIIGSRLKQSGTLWSLRGANAILALLANRVSGRFELILAEPLQGRMISPSYVAHPSGTNGLICA